MPSILASAIIDKAEIILLDTTNTRWPTSELLGWLNDGQREVCIHKPDACVVNKAVQLAAGTKQRIGIDSNNTADAVMFLDMPRNLGDDGLTPGPAIRPVSREILDTQQPDWHTGTAYSEVKHFTYDPRDPKHVYVFPRQDGTAYVEMVYAASPADLGSLAAAINVDDIYHNPLLDYVLYRAYSKDAEYAANVARATAHYQAFANAMGLRTAAMGMLNPNLNHAPFNPNVPGGQVAGPQT